jgi:hypothetical protein
MVGQPAEASKRLDVPVLVAERGVCERSSPVGHGWPTEWARMDLRKFQTDHSQRETPREQELSAQVIPYVTPKLTGAPMKLDRSAATEAVRAHFADPLRLGVAEIPSVCGSIASLRTAKAPGVAGERRRFTWNGALPTRR